MTKYMTVFVVFKDNHGSFNGDALAVSVHGKFHNYIDKYDGQNDCAFITFPSDNYDFFCELVDNDENVIEFRTIQEF